jgi:hypothetical protein
MNIFVHILVLLYEQSCKGEPLALGYCKKLDTETGAFTFTQKNLDPVHRSGYSQKPNYSTPYWLLEVI